MSRWLSKANASISGSSVVAWTSDFAICCFALHALAVVLTLVLPLFASVNLDLLMHVLDALLVLVRLFTRYDMDAFNFGQILFAHTRGR